MPRVSAYAGRANWTHSGVDCDDDVSACAPHKIDGLYRVDHLDRQEDRDVMEPTNLLESCDRMFDFGQKHLNDPFVPDGIRSGSAGDARTGAQFSRWKSSLGR